MRYRHITRPSGEFFIDTFKACVQSIRGFTCAQVFGNKFGFIKSYPMEKQNMEHVGNSLSLMIQDVEIMQKLHTDNPSKFLGKRDPSSSAQEKKE